MRKIFTCKKIVYYILLFFYSLNAQEFTLSKKYKNIKTTPQSKAILKDYEKFMNEISKKSFYEKIKRTNNYINTLNSIYDSDSNPQVDYWSTRGEFLSKGGGDCEDYAITKYYTLKDLGVDPKKMCLIVVQEKYSGFYHMVLGIWEKENQSPLILDNLSFKVLPFTKRTDLVPNSCMNEFGYFKVNKNGKKEKYNIKFKAYENMLKLQNKEKIWKK